MNTCGGIFLALGIMGLLVGLFTGTAAGTTVNIGLLADRALIVDISSTLCIVGAVFIGCAAVRDNLPAKAKPVDSPKPKKDRSDEKLRNTDLDEPYRDLPHLKPGKWL